MKYEIRFWFDFGGVCLWGINVKAKNKYGYAIDINDLNLSDSIKSELLKLQVEYSSYLDLTNPLEPSTWDFERKKQFLNNSKIVFDKMQYELGSDYKLIFDVEKNIDG